MTKTRNLSQTELNQQAMIKKYRLSRSDRGVILFGGIAGSTGVFNRKRTKAAVLKLINIGLLTETKTSYGYDYLLTPEGWEVHSKIYSTV